MVHSAIFLKNNIVFDNWKYGTQATGHYIWIANIWFSLLIFPSRVTSAIGIFVGWTLVGSVIEWNNNNN